MNKVMIYKVSLIVTAIFTFAGAVFKIQHWDYANDLFTVGYAASIAFVILGLRNVFQDKSTDLLVKIMWTIGFIFISWIAGLAYYQNYRKSN